MPGQLLSQPYRPHPALRPYVSSYLFTSVIADVPQTLDLFPVGHAVLSFALDEVPEVVAWGRSVNGRFNITGQLTEGYRLPVRGRFSYVYVLFRPFGAYPLLKVPQQLLAGNCLDFLDVGDRHALQLFRQMVDLGPDHLAVVRLLDRWLLRQLNNGKSDSRLDLVIHTSMAMERTGGAGRLADLCRQMRTSKSSLERHFQEKIGLNPKSYSNVVRFLRAMKTIREGNFTSWTDVVYRHHYFDQTHFIKEFRRFTGYTPSQFFESNLNMAGHFEEIRSD